MGPGVDGLVKDLVGKPRTLDDGRPGGFYVPRFRNLKDRHPGFIRGYGFEGSSGTGMFPGSARAPGFGAAYKKQVRELAGATIGMGGFGEVLSRYENAVSIDPVVKDKWGIPVLRFDFKFGDNEKKMAADMADTATRDVRGGRHRGRGRGPRASSPKAGPSTSWARRAWAPTPRRPCSTSTSSRTT